VKGNDFCDVEFDSTCQSIDASLKQLPPPFEPKLCDFTEPSVSRHKIETEDGSMKYTILKLALIAASA
jgi:hypothetical protein